MICVGIDIALPRYVILLSSSATKLGKYEVNGYQRV
jgi:hypothetical protein